MTEAAMANRTRLDPLVATQTTDVIGDIGPHELAAYAATARRGDVLPVCMRLDAARAASAWVDRTSIALTVGPVCPPHVLDTACAFMPRAVGPRLLRAAAALAQATQAAHAEARATWIDHARRDLEEAARLDPADVTVLVLRGKLADVMRGALPNR